MTKLYPHTEEEEGREDSQFLSMLTIGRLVGMDFERHTYDELREIIFFLDRWINYLVHMRAQVHSLSMTKLAVRLGEIAREVFRGNDLSD